MFIRNLKKSQKNGKNTSQIGNSIFNIKLIINLHHGKSNFNSVIQNILAHGWISPQPGFQVLSKGVKPYFQYHTKNKS